MTANGMIGRRFVEAFARVLLQKREASPPDTVLDDALIAAPGARDPGMLARLDAVAGRVLRH